MAGLPLGVAGILALAAMIVLTGAMHEDGMADVADGFWGGAHAQRRLEIMRDSQIGTYGVLALGIVTALKVSALVVLLDSGWTALVAAACLSRAMMPVVMYSLPAARDDGLSHSVGRPSLLAVLLGLLVGCTVALICLGPASITAIALAALATVVVAATAKRKIGGQTGDVIGATQNVSEAVILLWCAALFTP
jgi:adenosylcobinamide-GDP ribazoletransferase